MRTTLVLDLHFSGNRPVSYLPELSKDTTCADGEVCEVREVQCFRAPCLPVAECVSRCPDIMCAMFCQHGFQTDENGCNICRCVDPCEVSIRL